jgi:pterin-4a-carbinolamine dehydratase
MDSTTLKTPKQIAKEKREREIYDAYKQLMEVPGAMKTKVCEKLQETFNIKAYATMWAILKRVDHRKETQR